MSLDLWKAGKSLEWRFCLEVTTERLEQYAALSGDHNPIHFDTRVAQELGFAGTITHGMLNMGIMGRLVTPLLSDQIMVKEFRTRFLAPMLAGDSLWVSGQMADKNLEEASIRIQLEGKNQKQELILKGTVILAVKDPSLLPEKNLDSVR